MPQRLHDPDYVVLIRHLTGARQRLGVTQADLAVRLARPQSFVSKVERFERRLDIGEWRLVALALGEDPASLFAEACRLLEGEP